MGPQVRGPLALKCAELCARGGCGPEVHEPRALMRVWIVRVRRKEGGKEGKLWHDDPPAVHQRQRTFQPLRAGLACDTEVPVRAVTGRACLGALQGGHAWVWKARCVADLEPRCSSLYSPARRKYHMHVCHTRLGRITPGIVPEGSTVRPCERLSSSRHVVRRQVAQPSFTPFRGFASQILLRDISQSRKGPLQRTYAPSQCPGTPTCAACSISSFVM